jgi:hypothetical protein
MRAIAIIVMVLGLASLVFGVIFITQASAAEDEIAESIAPLKLNQVDSRYEDVKAKQSALKMAEEPAIQAGQAQPSAMYNYLSIQRTGLGKTRGEIGLASFTRMSGIINAVVGIGLILAGVGLLKKASA